jgi:hypothetical protein
MAATVGERKHDLMFVKVVHEAHGFTTEPPQDFCDLIPRVGTT